MRHSEVIKCYKVAHKQASRHSSARRSVRVHMSCRHRASLENKFKSRDADCCYFHRNIASNGVLILMRKLALGKTSESIEFGSWVFARNSLEKMDFAHTFFASVDFSIAFHSIL